MCCCIAFDGCPTANASHGSRFVVIPPLIHLTWKTKQLPYYGTSNLERWKELNPKHTITIYDDDDIHKFVLKHFAEFEPYWKQLKPVQKADLFRYVVMWKLGGVYADIDVEPRCVACLRCCCCHFCSLL